MSNPPTFSSSCATIVRRNRGYVALAATPVLLSVAAILGGLFGDTRMLAIAPHPILLSAFTLSWVWRTNPSPVTCCASVRVTGMGVAIDDRLIHGARIRSAHVATAPPRLVLRRRFALPLEISLESVKDARRAVQVLALGGFAAPGHHRTMSRAAALPRRAFFAIGGVVAAQGIAAAFAPPCTMAGRVLLALTGIVTALLFWPAAKIGVAKDGITLRRLGRARLLAYTEIARIDRYRAGPPGSQTLGVAVALVSGETLSLPIAREPCDDTDVAVAEESLRHASSVARVAADHALLGRAGRAVDAWLAALRSIGARAASDPSAAPVPLDRLFAMVENRDAPADVRCAAAVALVASALDAPGRARLRAAAETACAPRLRALIEQIAGDVAPIDETLAEIDAEDAARRALWAGQGFGS